MAASVTSTQPPTMALAASRRQLLQDSLGIMVSAGGFGLVYGITAQAAGFSPIEASAMSVLVFAGASQFVAIGYVAGGFSWLVIVGLTAFLNARHLLYSAALAPFLSEHPRWLRALMAHALTDEAFALAIAHFRRIGRSDVKGYWIGAFVSTFIPWNVATLIGVTVGGSIPDPARFGLDVIFPAAMGGLAVGLITGRRELVAAITGGVIAVAIALAWDPSAGIIAGGLIGPLAGMAVRPGRDDHQREGQLAYGPEPAHDHEDAVAFFPQRSGHAPSDPGHAGHADDSDHAGHADDSDHAGHAGDADHAGGREGPGG
jgi:4-azaleucine resistance transporter AzlC